VVDALLKEVFCLYMILRALNQVDMSNKRLQNSLKSGVAPFVGVLQSVVVQNSESLLVQLFFVGLFVRNCGVKVELKSI
jgi:hypothetical protein